MKLFPLGLDVALFIVPFHWRRSAGPLMQRGIHPQRDDAAMTCTARTGYSAKKSDACGCSIRP
ncbi:MAG TPA: hypothetical protein PLM53_10775 [Spirochaetota bacterium]|nr:hypothetical protein [Spirochaetota bacterium]HPC39336.1 hypothetical protein [Spirochaetota bacterium]HPL15143.1 hypothetical protein [Spirochaetota bacterium]HQF08726.1 hypothetical protein [Spirochaetota bacterium]HQH97573.1 hypothetical protein [Spirochaetota bacterium]